MKRIKASRLGLSVQNFPASILDVIEQLTRAGYQAYIVGGGVRDMILGLEPKDFDAVTNATPAQIKQVFGRRCRIIGRRFELAHVHSGREIIEVATFRKTPKKSLTSASGMILRDNHWGTIEDDFVRRDFTVNALYYQPKEGVVLDFCGAIEDIQQQRLRLLGDPKQRFEEDPVRMLRTIRFAAKLNFDIDGKILAVLNEEMTQLLRDVSPHRMYDESQKLFSSGCLARIVPMLIHYKIWQHLFQDVPAKITPLIQHAAKNTDLRLQQGKSINPAFFYAVLLWQTFVEKSQAYEQKGKNQADARIQAGIDVIKRQSMRTVIPRFTEWFIRETWEIQYRLIEPKAARIMALLGHERFRAGFDFLQMREKVKEIDTHGMVDWWDNFQTLSNDEKQLAISEYQRRLVKKRHQQKAELAQEKVEQAKSKKTTRTKNSAEKAEPSVENMVLDIEQNEPEILLANEKAPKIRPARVSYEETSEKHPITRRKRVQRDISAVLELQRVMLNCFSKEVS